MATAIGTYGAASLATLSIVGAALTIPWPTEVAACPIGLEIFVAACPIGLVIFFREKPRFYICTG